MSPKAPSVAVKDQMSTKLPKGKTIVDVFADFMRYLFDSTKTLFKTSEKEGEVRWDSVSNNIELVVTHPFGWCEPPRSERALSLTTILEFTS